jgi:N-acetylneuraminic acid mutarotase
MVNWRQATRLTIAAAFGCSLVGAAAAQQDPAPGAWGKRAPMLEANSEFTTTELDGKIYVFGGYPSTRKTVTTFQIYDVKSNTWRLGPPLLELNNHGVSAAVDGVLYLLGGQTDEQRAYTDRVFAYDPKTERWTEKARMPTKRSAGWAVVHEGKIYVAGGRPPHGHVFEVYDPKADKWETLPNLPSQRNHIAGALINGKIHIVGGRLEGGFTSAKTTAHEAYDPKTRTWSVAAPLLKARSGVNGVMANGCFHVWGGEHADGMFPDHDYYDPRSDKWTKLPDMAIPVHGVTGAAFFDGLIWVTGGGTSNGGSSGTTLNQVYRPAVRCE